MKRILALDYGRARVGVAVSAGTLAEPLTVLPANDTLQDQISKLCQEHRINQLVIGISEKDMAEESQKWGQEISAALNLPVTFQDETLSSVEVQQRLRSARSGKRAYSGWIDHYAAAVILERYIDDQGDLL